MTHRAGTDLPPQPAVGGESLPCRSNEAFPTGGHTMHMTKLARPFALAALAASITVGVTQASAQGVALGHSEQLPTAAAASNAAASPLSLKWIRAAVAAPQAHTLIGKIHP